MDSFYITTPIYYVNSKPHLGHAYTTILCDAVKRFYVVAGRDSYFLTGTDEHGDKIAKAAATLGVDPQALCDQNSQHFKELLPILNSTHDDFIRTTDVRHKKVVQDILQKVYDKGDIYKAEYTGKYCYGCERYLADDDLFEGKCRDHQKEPELISEENYFFKMSAYWERLQKHIEEHPDFVTESFRNEVIGLLKMEPQDLCISRPKSRLTWGVELPFDSDYVTYVWFDALINYVSALDYPDGEKFKKYWPQTRHVIAKDILKPHCIYWPTMLMSAGISLPKQVAIHGYWLSDDSKMSKSLGNVIDPFVYCEKYTSDVFRYFLIRGMRFGRDASFDHQVFLETCNAELSNNFGNLVSRTFGMLKKNFDSQIPDAKNLHELDKELELQGLALQKEVTEAMRDWHVAEYLEAVVAYGHSINKYLDATKPWSLAKEDSQRERLASVLRTTLEAIRLCFAWLYPVIPKKATEVLESMGIEVTPARLYQVATSWNGLQAGHVLPKKAPGFPRLED